MAGNKRVRRKSKETRITENRRRRVWAIDRLKELDIHILNGRSINISRTIEIEAEFLLRFGKPLDILFSKSDKEIKSRESRRPDKKARKATRGRIARSTPLTKKEPTRKQLYDRYIKSSKWRKKREELFLERGKICEKCSSGDNIHVHHLHYDNLFDEKLEDLQVLCKECHRKEHPEKDYKKIDGRKKKKAMKNKRKRKLLLGA